jgi:hypothetical protein
MDTPGGYGLPVYVTSLPGSGSPLRYSGSIVLLSTDGKLYRFMSGAWTKAVDGGDITANSIVTNAIVAGAITAPLIAAGAVTASKLYVGDTTNLINDPTFLDQTGYWTRVDPLSAVCGFTSSATVIGALNTSIAGLFSLSGIPSGNTNSFSISTPQIPINAGKQYRVRADLIAISSANKSFYMALTFFQGDGATGAGTQVIGPTVTVAFTSAKEYLTQFTAPSNAAFVLISFFVSGNQPSTVAGTGAWLIGSPRLERLSDGTLIEDGSITTDHIVVGGLDASAITAGTVTGDRMTANFIDGERFATIHTSGQPFIEVNGQSNSVGGHQNGPWFRANDGTYDRVIMGQLQDLWGLWIRDSSGNLVFEEASLGTAVVATGNIATNAVTLPYSFTQSGNLTLSDTGWTSIWSQAFTVSAPSSVLLSTVFFGYFLAGIGTINGFRVRLDGSGITSINALCEIIVTVGSGSHTIAIEGQGDTSAGDPFILESGATATILACQR